MRDIAREPSDQARDILLEHIDEQHQKQCDADIRDRVLYLGGHRSPDDQLDNLEEQFATVERRNGKEVQRRFGGQYKAP